jgi:hypothetical protein
MYADLALARLKAFIALADHIDPTTAPDNAAVPMAFLKRF